MARKNNYSKKDFMNPKNVRKAARKAGLEMRNGKGDHVIVYSPNGTDSIPYCDREMGYGLACSIWKKFVKWGVIIGLFFASCYLMFLVQSIP